MRKNGIIFGLAYLLGALSALGLGSWQPHRMTTASIDAPTVMEETAISAVALQPIAPESPCDLAESDLVASISPIACDSQPAADKATTEHDKPGLNIVREPRPINGLDNSQSESNFSMLVLNLTAEGHSGILIAEKDAGAIGVGQAQLLEAPAMFLIPDPIAGNDPQASRPFLQTVNGITFGGASFSAVSLGAGCCVATVPPGQTPLANCQFQPTLRGPFSSDPVTNQPIPNCGDSVTFIHTNANRDNLGFDRRQLCQEGHSGITLTMNTAECSLSGGIQVGSQLTLQANAAPCDVDIDSLAPMSDCDDEAIKLQELREKLVDLVASKAKLQSEKSLRSEISRVETETANLQAARKIVEAQQSLQKIIDEFPNSPAATRAKSMLELKAVAPAKNIPTATLPIY